MHSTCLFCGIAAVEAVLVQGRCDALKPRAWEYCLVKRLAPSEPLYNMVVPHKIRVRARVYGMPQGGLLSCPCMVIHPRWRLLSGACSYWCGGRMSTL
jgi:hypothetical protein